MCRFLCLQGEDRGGPRNYAPRISHPPLQGIGIYTSDLHETPSPSTGEGGDEGEKIAYGLGYHTYPPHPTLYAFSFE